MSNKLSVNLHSISELQNSLKNDLKKIGINKLDKPNFGNIYFLIDCSGSMSSDEKLVLAKKGAIDYTQEAKNKGFSIGLIKFGSEAKHILEPQSQLDNLINEINKISISGSTNMTDAIRLASEKLTDRTGEKVIFIVTDGVPNNKESALAEAISAKKKGIDIMTLGTDDADAIFLSQISTKKEFSNIVSHKNLQQGISSMAKLLPGSRS